MMKGILQKNQQEMNKHWQDRNKKLEEIRMMGIITKNQVEIFFLSYYKISMKISKKKKDKKMN